MTTMPITLTLPGRPPAEYPDAAAAITALVPLLANDQLNLVVWGDRLRAESRRRWACPGPQGAVGAGAVRRVNGD